MAHLHRFSHRYVEQPEGINPYKPMISHDHLSIFHGFPVLFPVAIPWNSLDKSYRSQVSRVGRLLSKSWQMLKPYDVALKRGLVVDMVSFW